MEDAFEGRHRPRLPGPEPESWPGRSRWKWVSGLLWEATRANMREETTMEETITMEEETTTSGGRNDYGICDNYGVRKRLWQK